MRTLHMVTWTIFLFVFLCSVNFVSAAVVSGQENVPKVFRLSPKVGSLDGETRITIHGENFAKTLFNLDPKKVVGVSVVLSSVTGSYPCKIHKDGTDSQKITCYTSPMPEGKYSVKVKVNGKDVDDDNYCSTSADCEFEAVKKNTPTITQLYPMSGLPGQIIKIIGDLKTSKYGSNLPDESQSNLLRVYFGGQKCELLEDAEGEFDLSYSDGNGHMTCKTGGTYIGDNKISYIVSKDYGRSKEDGKTKFPRSNGISMYQTFTEIKNLSLSGGSTLGGTKLTITGKHFDVTQINAKVRIAGKPCHIEGTVTDDTIVCHTSSNAGVGSGHFQGGRGLYAYVVDGTVDVTTIDRSVVTPEFVDVSDWRGYNLSAHTVLMNGFFLPVTSGSYSFCIKAASTADVYLSTDADPANKVLVGRGDDTCGGPMTFKALEKDKSYYIEVHYHSSKMDSYVTVVSFLKETEYTEEDTNWAQHEIQKVSITSATDPEIQEVDVTASGNTTQIPDVQTLVIEGDPTTQFVIGLDGIYTTPFTLQGLDGDDVKAALKKLPGVLSGLEDIQVAVTSQAAGKTLVITTDSPFGAIGDYQAVRFSDSGAALNFTTSRTTLGVAASNYFALSLNGTSTKALMLGASANQVKSELELLFNTRCHPEFVGSDVSSQASDAEPFCGHSSAKNPGVIFWKDPNKMTYLTQTGNRWMCMAYKGMGGIKSIKIRYEHIDGSGSDPTTKYRWMTVSNSLEDLNDWNYWCDNLFDRLKAVSPNGRYSIVYIKVYRKYNQHDLYVDEFAFRKEAPFNGQYFDKINDLWRKPQVRPNGFFIESVQVAKSSDKYTVTLKPHDCGYNLPLINALHADVTRKQNSSIPITGTYNILFKGDTTANIPVTAILNPEAVADTLALSDVGDADVSGKGTCSAFYYDVKMVSHTGDQPLMSLDTSKLSGASITAGVTVVQNGGLWLSPIMGDLLRTHHSTPQVIAYINNIPTKCADNSACSFKWDPTATPVLTSITPPSGSNGQIVQISGNGFSSDTNGNTVTLGATSCRVTAATGSLITCEVSSGPSGPAQVMVNVDDKGYASGNVTFTFITGVTNSPSGKTGSLAGGTVLSFQGFGFTPDAAVSVGGNPCEITDISETNIECNTPPATTLNTTNVNVEVVQPGSTKPAGDFTYRLIDTPIVTSINVTSSPVSGGGVILISGTDFGNAAMPVSLGGEDMTVLSYDDTDIVAVLPALPHGSYQILINVQPKGYADLRTNSIADIEYSSVVNDMTPDFGSIYGGTDLTIDGQGFVQSGLDVHVGDHVCDVKSVTTNCIQCRIADTGLHHDISATGTHKNYGVGYAWNKSPYSIAVGDTVTWDWEAPFYANVKYSVRQTATAQDTQDMPGGFSSGDNTAEGKFTHRFSVAGTYYYWTGYMDSGAVVYFRGVLHVRPIESINATLSVKIMGNEVAYDDASASTRRRRSGATCPPTSTSVSGCIDDKTFHTESGKFNFNFLKCSSPFIDSLSPNNGSFDDVISLGGDGFGNSTCQNEVTYGEDGCTTGVLASSTPIQFKISRDCKPPIGELHTFKVRVNNLGYALMSLPPSSSAFALVPIVEDISPKTGSKVGGTLVTITGAGFIEDKVEVMSQETLQCDVESVSYEQVVCRTRCVSADQSNCFVGEVPLAINVGVIPAKCDSTVCKFTTTVADTPIVDSVTPSSVSAASTQLTFAGSKLGSSAANLTVHIGGVECVVGGTVTPTGFKCDVGRLPVGDNKVTVYVSNLGHAATSAKVTSEAIASISSPAKSSIHGGADLVIDGNGFVADKTVVKVDGIDCVVQSANLSQVVCTLPARSVGSRNVIVTSNGVTYPTKSLDYASDATPVVNSVTPTGGKHGDVVTVAGSGFAGPDGQPEVTIGGVECAVSASTDASITCTAGIQSTGKFPVQVFVKQRGHSNKDIEFTYQVGNFTVYPAQGSTNGGQLVTLTGSGFLEDETNVTICDEVCDVVSVTSSVVVCKTPSHAAATCNVKATVKTVMREEPTAYTFDASLVSTVTGVSPGRGGTGGGNVITITGTNFGTTPGDIQVTIAGSPCTNVTVTDTEITCRTGNASSVVAQVEVQRNGQGLAEQVDATYEYVDLWSNIYTWGGNPIPAEGEMIIIPKGQKILLDVNTPVLELLILQGGHLVFDEQDIELQAKYILITDGGILEIGTEEKPFEHKAIVTLHGHVRSKELPVYGAKGIGLREGRLEFHGKHVPITWTKLDSTAAAGTSTLNLMHSVTWQTGDEIVIATTGDRFSQKENEVREIATVNGDGTEITLTEALEYEHIGTTATFGSRQVEFRAEVGLLTRNVLIRGHRNVAFDTNITACEEGFNPGEFATQTCFQGRFGEEVGSDQYGVHILIHQQEKDTQVAQAHIENTEITHAGQAFRLGRYPVHFHLNGDMSQSYVRGCAIHHTFNRAVNLHGVHNTMVENNVIFDVMGGALFLEDGIETGNTFQYNLEIFVKSSTSLLNDDITPAAIWVTNPNNIVRHNAAAGGTHFGAWYRMHAHPDGPSADKTICLQNTPLGEYSNNTAHSQGWFGLWIFETYVPKDRTECSGAAQHKVAKFYSLTAWNNNEGAEAVNAGAIQFINFVAVNNAKSGIHFSLITGNPPQYDPENGPGVFNSLIVAHHTGLKGVATGQGIVQPHYNGFMVKDVEFHNFDKTRSSVFSWVTIAGVCTTDCGGFTSAVSGLTFVNSPRKVRFAWENEGVISDLDGSLTGTAGDSAVACSGSFDPNECSKNTEMSLRVDGCVCSKKLKFFRFAFNNIQPQSLLYKKAIFTSEFGQTFSPWHEKRISHKKGWQVVLMTNTSYDFTFENADHIVNISYDARLYSFTNKDHLILTQEAYQMPDIFQLDGSNDLTVSGKIPEGSGVANGDWFYDSNTTKITYALRNSQGNEMPVRMRATRCFYRGCVRPPSMMSVLKMPSNAENTSIPSTWNNITKHGNPPNPMDDIHIAADRWILVDSVLPKLGKVVIDGGLQFAEDFLTPNLLEADYIYIRGRLVAGFSEEAPFRGSLTIRLRGEHSTPDYVVSDGPNLGKKFIGVFGGLQLHGVNRDVTKTTLESEAAVGDTTITVSDAVDWKAGEEIIISTTDYNAWHTEVFEIKAVSGRTLTLDGSIQHRHVVIDEASVELRANVALLSRNIKVEGADYTDLMKESFGARIVVGETIYEKEFYTGFAQVSNVEFYRCGQEGFTSNFDPRFALSYLGVPNIKGDLKYSYVRNNAFHHGFSPAVGAFGISGLEITNNTIYRTVGPGIRTEATGTQITGNLVTLSIWPGAYQDRQEPDNYDFSGGIDAIKAEGLVLKDNVVAGSERAAYTVRGQACGTPAGELWSGNVGSGSQSGVAMFMINSPADGTCTMFSGFTLWKNFDYGIYYFNSPSLVVSNCVFVENSVGVMPFVAGPSATSHAYAEKTVTVENSLFVGKTSTFSETLDKKPSDDNVRFSGQARGQSSSKTCGKVGIVAGTFTSGSNVAPRKPWVAIMSYQAIGGLTKVKGNTFSNYGSCGGGSGFDHIIATNKDNDDVIHPVQVSASTLAAGVEHKAKILFHEPNVGKINPSDCVDMDCDAHKKCLITDLDGTFLGWRGNVLPEAAFEWGGDSRRGLNDGRIPTPLYTTPAGDKLDVNKLAQHKGLYKIDECQWVAEWVAYQCNNSLEWRMLVAESMDSDTETRRISPVAVWSKAGYLDLVNGPQDHGWCSGYTCQKRLSTFPILVALDQPFELFLTGSNPKVMRYILLNSQPTDCVQLSMFYTTINRLEIKVDGKVITPNNGFYDKNGRYRIKLEETKGQWMPHLQNKSAGENYISQETQIITWVQCGGNMITVTRKEALLVAFTLPEMTVDEFFGENLVENLAAFLNIDPKKVRIVNVVTNNSPTGRRKRRATATSTVYVEISDSPGEADSINLSEVVQKVVLVVQTGNLDEVLKTEVLYTSIVEPGAESEEPVVLKKPGHLVLATHPEGLVSENIPFTSQPKLKVTDTDGNVVPHLGSSTLVWEVEASIKSGGNSKSALLGTTRLNFTAGWANFTDLAINDPGVDYILEFNIVYPLEAANYSIQTNKIVVKGRSLSPKATLPQSKRLTGSPIQMEVVLVDTSTGLDVTDINWDNHTWEAEVSIYDTQLYAGSLTGTTKVALDQVTGKGTFSNLLLSDPGNVPLSVTIKSDPVGYDLKMVVYVDVITPAQDAIVVEVSKKMEMTFPITFNPDRARYWAVQVVNEYSKIPGLKITGYDYRAGSTIITLTIEASTAGFNNTLSTLCSDLDNGRNFTFDGTTVKMSGNLNINGKPHYGVNCGPTHVARRGDDDELDLVYIIIIAVLGALVLLLVGLLLYKCHNSQKSKTSDITTVASRNGIYANQDLLADVLLREESASSFKKSTGISPMAPSSTKAPSPFDMRIQSPGIDTPPPRTPSPAWVKNKY